MMICKQCGKEIDDNSQFCEFCGAKQETEVVEIPKKEKKSDNTWLINVIIIILLLIGCVYKYNNFKDKLIERRARYKQDVEYYKKYHKQTSQQQTHKKNFSSNKKNTTNTIDEVDFKSYMEDLQKNIKVNWTPPKDNKSKKVVLNFSINKNGSLGDIKISESSGSKEIDESAISAIKEAAPFKPLPREFKQDKVDIMFTFDYNYYK